eukprot:TRINITY_DN17006_c2_g2_i1.p1 TRINITY_DN17006_c2_g2~~TRINITY_DN17006_c2_g2_i1.p1  ORF type:complete len:256 (-),score=69.13 TRINITY_DN17006_c2_g2_i1:119-844(-)
MARRVLILGAGGQLGRTVGDVFKARQWITLGADPFARGKVPVAHFLSLDATRQPEDQGRQLLAELQKELHGEKLDAVVNVAGGFAMGSAADSDMIGNMRNMIESSLYSSVAAAHVATQALKPGGLIVLPGAAAALSPTAWSLPYGAAKVAVHHLVRSLADVETSGLPADVKTIGIAPQTLDTAQNREAMPDADRGSWASLEEVSEQLEAWCADPSTVTSGNVYVINKAGGLPATFESKKAL